MKDIVTNKIKNIALAGHNGSGKTSLAEALLFKAGASDRLGKTADGTTVCDYDPEEIRRHISIGTSLASFDYDGFKVNLLDTPGLFDFAAEMTEGIRAADTVMITVSAKSGVKVGARKAYDEAVRQNKSKM
ncbi:MAG: 50S ribosome-binding GTPase, partial [Ruminococcus sp.]|nr:50S ribosome-binding GTPase [Ruminococcus sp.]